MDSQETTNDLTSGGPRNRPAKGEWSAVNLLYAWHGFIAAWREEGGFRNQIAGAVCMLVLLIVIRPEPYWWALGLLGSAMLIALELFNCAVERTIDHVDDRFHPQIKRIKDMSAGAVVAASFGVLLLGIVMVVEVFLLIR